MTPPRRHPATDARRAAQRAAAFRTRYASRANASLPRLPGWVSESTIAVGEEAHLVRVYREGDAPRQPYVAKLLRSAGPDGEPRGIDERRARLLREVVALRALGEAGCPSIPAVITLGVGTDAAPLPWYVMPYYEGGAMWTDGPEGGRWAESYRGNVDRVLEIVATLATTLAFLHDGARRCVHGQVIAGNVLLDGPSGRAILADFGHARIEGYALGPAEDDVDAGWRWRPPELDRDTATPASDVYMLGGLLYEALSGGRLLPPASRWPTPTIHERPEYALCRDADDPRLGPVEALLGRMLVTRPERRFSARQVARACRAIRRAQTIGGRPLFPGGAGARHYMTSSPRAPDGEQRPAV